MTSGIYKLYFKQNPTHFYIGSSKNINQRFKEHRNQLSKGTHDNPILNKAFKKYGFENLISEFIEECNIDSLRQVEQKYIDTLKPHYNISKRADGGKCNSYWVFNYKKEYRIVYGIKEECKRLGIALDNIKKYSDKYIPTPSGFFYRKLTEEEYKLGYMFHNRTGFLFISTTKRKNSPSTYFTLNSSIYNIRIERTSLEDILNIRNKLPNFNVETTFNQLEDCYKPQHYTKLNEVVLSHLKYNLLTTEYK